MSSQKPLRLITISVSHYCEKVRWALTKLNIPYVEEAHIPPFHIPIAKGLGGKLTPILVTENQVIHDSTEILQYLDKIVPDESKLFPIQPELRQQVEDLENLFDEELGITARLWGYSHTINQPQLIKQAWCRDVPVLEKLLFPFTFPIVKKVIKTNFKINDNSQGEAYTKIQEILTMVSGLLADGRKFLVGDKFTAADLTFAALAAPFLLPQEHPKRRPNIQDLPPKMLAEIEEFRQTAAGKFGLRLYGTQRF